VNTIDWKGRWREQETEALRQMACRIELNKSWHDLDNLLVESVVVVSSRHGVWKCRSVPAVKGVERRLGLTSLNALQIACGSAHDRGRTQHVFSSENVTDAKRMVRTALHAYVQTAVEA
jgi:hypothetical protein